MKIVFVSEFYSRGMGYTENCLPKVLAALGHDVHVVTSQLQVYGHAKFYEKSYGGFLGERVQPEGVFEIDGYTVHRLPVKIKNIPIIKPNPDIYGYIEIQGHGPYIRDLKPDVIQTRVPSDLNTFPLVKIARSTGIPLFTECHMHMSVMRPEIREGRASIPLRAAYWLTRTAPGQRVGSVMKKCYAIADDCLEVAVRFYGFPREKCSILSLGTDTDHFVPRDEAGDAPAEFRTEHGIAPNEILVVYTGRFAVDKNPLILARAIDSLRKKGHPYRGLFVGDGIQRAEIEACDGCQVLDFIPYTRLNTVYQASDICCWPTQESMSMLDASSCAIPVVVCENMGQKKRIEGNGLFYQEDSAEDLAAKLLDLADPAVREKLGQAGRQKMVETFSWRRNALLRLQDYEAALLQKV